MSNISQRIQEIEEEIRKTPYHKATEHHIGKLKARLARLKEELLDKSIKKGGGGGFFVKKTGDATVVLVGPPSVGKSSLLNKLTSAQSKVASYAFTTTEVIPGMLEYNGAKIQIFDIPGLISGASQGKGKGKEIISVTRSADLILIMVDIFTLSKIKEIKEELFKSGLRLNQKPPEIYFKKTHKGGIKIISSTPLNQISEETIKEVASEFKFKNGEIYIKENISLQQLIDSFLGNCKYISYFLVINKVDLTKNFFPKLNEEYILISCQKDIGIDRLKNLIWQKLNLIRVYLKPKDREPDFKNPYILKKGKTLKDLLNNISICTKSSFRQAKVYGPGANFPGQNVSLKFCPLDGTIVTFL